MTELQHTVATTCEAVKEHLVETKASRAALDGWSKVAIAIGPALAAAIMWWITHYGTVAAVADAKAGR